MPDKKDILKWLPSYQKSPHKPGVYWFMDEKGKVLYVGKAKDLKNRLASYTQLNQVHGKTKRMVLEARQLKYQVQDNELTALLVEAELIKLHQPGYNVLLKDDKTPLYIYLTNGKYPLVKKIRKKDIQRLKVTEKIPASQIFGPYQSAYRTKQILKIVRPIFKWCEHPAVSAQTSVIRKNVDSKKLTTDDLRLKSVPKPCFYYHIDRCSGACIGKISPDEYLENIDRLAKFLRGKTKEVLTEFKQEMQQASDAEEFERAAEYRDAIQLIENFMKPTFQLKPDLQLPKLQQSLTAEGLLYLRKELRSFYSLSKDYPLHRIEGFDVSNIQGKNATVSLVCFTEGKPDKANYRLFNIRTIHTPNDYHMMKEAITRRQKHPEWGRPSLIVIDGGRGQLRSALSVWKWPVPVVSLVKNPDRLVIPVFVNPTEPSLKNLQYHFVHFPEDHPTLRLLQQIRDESHRFAKKQHTRLRNKNIVI